MQQSCSRARIRVTQCESERGARAGGNLFSAYDVL